MAELRAGGLALVIGLKVFSDQNGKSVTLVEKLKSGEKFTFPDGRTKRYTGRADNAAASGWICTGDLMSVNGDVGWSILLEKNLLPIGGDDFTDEIEEVNNLSLSK